MWDIVDATESWKLQGNLFRLSCPLLVEAIDSWEAEGAIGAFNEELLQNEEL